MGEKKKEQKNGSHSVTSIMSGLETCGHNL